MVKLGSGVLYAIRATATWGNNKIVGRGFLCGPCRGYITRCYDYESLETAVRRVGGWCEMAASLGVSQLEQWVSRYQATTGEDTADWGDFVRAAVKCRVCELALALYLFLVTFCKSSINTITNPNPVYNHSNHVTIGVRSGVHSGESLKHKNCRNLITVNTDNKIETGWVTAWCLQGTFILSTKLVRGDYIITELKTLHLRKYYRLSLQKTLIHLQGYCSAPGNTHTIYCTCNRDSFSCGGSARYLHQPIQSLEITVLHLQQAIQSQS
jgi:hypothetical protein